MGGTPGGSGKGVAEMSDYPTTRIEDFGHATPLDWSILLLSKPIILKVTMVRLRIWSAGIGFATCTQWAWRRS